MYVVAGIPYLLASYIVLGLLILTISYVIIIIVKTRSNPPPQHYNIVDRKLSITLSIVTVASILTILPWAFFSSFV